MKENQVFVDQNNQPVYGGLLYGMGSFATLKEMKTREFLKGGSAIFTLDFQGKNMKVVFFFMRDKMEMYAEYIFN